MGRGRECDPLCYWFRIEPEELRKWVGGQKGGESRAISWAIRIRLWRGRKLLKTVGMERNDGLEG